MPLMRSISGLRATLGDSMTPEIISRNVAAFESTLEKGNIIIGRDGRPSGRWIEQIVAGTLAACGRNIIILGVVPTPTIQLFVEKSNAAGGISITASHNPKEWNGLKFMNSNGVFFDYNENSKMWDAEKFGDFKYINEQIGGDIFYENDAIEKHINSVLNLPLFDNDTLNKLKNRRFKVTVDAVNSAGSKAIPELLKNLGCQVDELFCDGSGIFPHIPEPVPKNLKQLCDAVKNNNSDLGIAVDPDADRLVFIDEKGEPVGEEKTIVLAVETVLSNIDKFPKTDDEYTVTVNLSTTQIIDDICKNYNIKLFRSAVGEINVIKTMKKNNSIIGGEGSGGVILPLCHYGRDSLVGTALVLYLMLQRDKKLSEIVSEFPFYNMVKTKCFFDGNLTKLYTKIPELFPNGKIIKGDGIKVLFTNSWIHIRASNTEPFIRIIAEDPSLKEAKRLVNTVVNQCISAK